MSYSRRHFCRIAIYLSGVRLAFVLCHLWSLRAKAFLIRTHNCTHLCEHLAPNCTTFNTSGTGHFCLSCDIWLFGQTCKCVHPCMLPPHPPTHSHPLKQASHSQHTHPSIQPHTHARTLMWILSVVLSWGSRPVRSPRRSGDQGRKSLSRPQAPPSAPCLGSRSWEADAM